MEYRFQAYRKSPIIRNHLKMGGTNSRGEKIEINSLYFSKGGTPWIGTMGEYHFSRDDRANWPAELAKMKAGGIRIVSTYVFWIYHEEEEGIFDFSGNNDIRAFFQCVRDAGLEICLRLGPWVNGECRNGGFPDWLLKKDCERRTNDPGYLVLVERYWRRLYEEVKNIPLLMIQIENELVDRPDHISALKQLALAIGFQAPVFTATGWNGVGGAMLPLDETVPVFGGYPEAPWERHQNKLPPSSHFFFNRMRNDTAIGADLMVQQSDDGWRLPYERYPFATCELGGGVQIGHHRRPVIRPMDIYALSLVELGSGNNLIGYYMFHGGTNGIGRKSTFNVRFCPIRNYDFQAPISQYGEIRQHYRLLNLLNLFAEDFGGLLAPMEMTEAEQPVGRYDTESLRYAMRTDGKGGFVFINHYQRLDQLKDIEGAVLNTGSVVFPPVNIRGEICFFFPFNLQLGRTKLCYATAQPFCRVDNTCFFVEIPGIDPVFAFEGKVVRHVRAGLESMFREGDMLFVTLTWDQALYARKLEGQLYIGKGEDVFLQGGQLKAASANRGFSWYLWNADHFELHTEGEKGDLSDASLTREPCAAPFLIPEEYARFLNAGHERRVNWFRLSVSSPEGFIEITDEYDVAQLYVDGKLVADSFYYGLPWRIPAALLYGGSCYLAESEMENDFYREF